MGGLLCLFGGLGPSWLQRGVDMNQLTCHRVIVSAEARRLAHEAIQRLNVMGCSPRTAPAAEVGQWDLA